jgi:N-acetylmuramoyl-L-alanine amidase
VGAIVFALVSTGAFGDSDKAPAVVDNGTATPAVIVGTNPPTVAVSPTSAPPGSAVPAGTCQTFSPTNGSRQSVVFLDPGHGGVDPGASGTTTSGETIYEKDLTLAVGLDLRDLLVKDGYTVVMSRTEDTTVFMPTEGDMNGGALSADGERKDLEARDRCANSVQAQVLVAIHFNAFNDPSVGGVETFYDDARPFSPQNLRLADLIQKEITDELATAGWDVPDRGVATDSSDDATTLTEEGMQYGHFFELGPAQPGYQDNPSRMPGALVESLFITNAFEADIAARSLGQQAIAQGLSLAIEQFLGG